VHLFRSESEFSGRGTAEAEQARTKGTFWRPHELQSKRHHWKNFKLILSNFFKYIDQFSNTYILTIFCSMYLLSLITLRTKLEISYLQYNYILIYIIYGGRTMIGFRC
jgi:hypothetical protein